MESKESHSEDASGSSSYESKQSEANDRSLAPSDLPDSEKISKLITEEAVRSRVRALIDRPAKRSRLEAISTNPSIAIVLGFVLTGIIGGFLTYYYGRQQHELAARRSFSDEINKTRVQKLGEVWEQVDLDEFTINNMLEERRLRGPDKESAANKDWMADITELIHKDQSIASKNRFWLGEPMYKTTMVYLDASIEYAARNVGSKSGADLTELIKKRDAARDEFLRLRSLLLEGEANPQEKPTR